MKKYCNRILFKNIKREISSAIIISIFISLLSGCSAGNTVSTSESPSASSADSTIALTIDGETVTLDTYEYFALQSAKNLFENYPNADWESTFEGESISDYIKKDALEAIKLYRSLEETASKYSISLTDSDKQALQNLDSDGIEQFGSADAYDKYLAQNWMNRKIYYYLNYCTFLYTDIYNVLYGTNGSKKASDDEIKSFATKQNYITVNDIVFYTVNPDTKESLSTAQIEKSKESADAALAELDKGADFTKVMKEYSQDSSTSSITFTKNKMESSFESAAYALKEGEYSAVIKTSYGYHIIKRLPIDLSQVWSEYYSVALFENMCMDVMNKMSVQTTEAYEQLDPQTLFKDYFES